MRTSEEPDLSVITVTLDDPEGLAETVRSVESQRTDAGVEHLVIDGMSGYDVGALLRRVASRAQLVREPDDGLYDAMNKGIARARGRYLLFLNSGDVLCDCDVVASVTRALAKHRPDLACADSYERDAAGTLHYKPSRKPWKIPFGMPTHHQAMFFRRDPIQAHGLAFDLAYPLAADYKFVLEFCRLAPATVRLGFPVATFLAGGLSQTNVAQGRNEQAAIRSAHYGSPGFAGAIKTLQRLLFALRDASPRLYWLLKVGVRR